MKKGLITLALSSLTFCSGCVIESGVSVQPEVKVVKQPVSYIYINRVLPPRPATQTVIIKEYSTPPNYIIVNPAPNYPHSVPIPKINSKPEYRHENKPFVKPEYHPDKKHEDHNRYEQRKR